MSMEMAFKISCKNRMTSASYSALERDVTGEGSDIQSTCNRRNENGTDENNASTIGEFLVQNIGKHGGTAKSTKFTA